MRERLVRTHAFRLGSALLPGVCGLGARRSAVRLLDERRFRRAADRGDARRRDHRACRAIRAARLERPDPDRGSAQRRRSRRRLCCISSPIPTESRSPAISRPGRPACRPTPGWLSFTLERRSSGRSETSSAPGQAVRDPGRLSLAGRTRHQRRGGLPQPESRRPCCGPGWSRSASA